MTELELNPIWICLPTKPGLPFITQSATHPKGEEATAAYFPACQTRDWLPQSRPPSFLPPHSFRAISLLKMTLALLSHQRNSSHSSKPTSRLNSCSDLKTDYISSSPYQAFSQLNVWPVLCAGSLAVPQVCVILWVLIYQHLTLDDIMGYFFPVVFSHLFPCALWARIVFLAFQESESEVKVLVTQSYPTLCNPMDCSPPGSSVHEILSQEHKSGLPFPSPGDLSDPGVEPGSPALQVNSLPYCFPSSGIFAQDTATYLECSPFPHFYLVVN